MQPYFSFPNDPISVLGDDNIPSLLENLINSLTFLSLHNALNKVPPDTLFIISNALDCSIEQNIAVSFLSFDQLIHHP